MTVEAKKRMYHYRVLTPDCSEHVYAIEMSEVPTPPELREEIEPHLGGARMQQVRVKVGGKPTDMFIDELMCPKELPRNERATAIYRSNWLSTHPDDDPESLPYICGSVVIFDEIVWT